MLWISHRGNLNGPTKDENHPTYISKALMAGFDVEVDVWHIAGSYYLGHDEPQYQIDQAFLNNKKFWCHAKNSTALSEMINNGINCFWHDKDEATLTSHGHIWCYPEKYFKNSIMVDFGLPRDLSAWRLKGICTDIPTRWKNEYEQILEK